MKKNIPSFLLSIFFLGSVIFGLFLPAEFALSQGNFDEEQFLSYRDETIALEESSVISSPVLLVVDNNPEMQNIRFPRTQEIQEAISGSRDVSTVFEISYKTAGTTDLWGASCIAFPENAKSAFNAATAIWANTIQSSVPIKITACWSNALSSGVLGYSGGGYWWQNFSGAPLQNVLYQSALANSYAGADLLTSRDDMYITYNSSFNWYYGTDGNTPSGSYDLVTVAAHEIAHGLNFAGWMNYSGGIAEYGYNGYPSIYENFLESQNGQALTSYANPSRALGDLVTSNNLWWDGTNANAANGGSRVKMYAPSSWSPGSSYSHLDYSTFAGSANSLMVYAIGSGSSQHNPGPVTKGILMDMGWTIQGTPDVPSGISASDGTFTDKVQVSWNTVNGATSYKVYRNTINPLPGEEGMIGTPTSSFFDDTTALPGTNYYYWIKACMAGVCSDYSSFDTGWREILPLENFIFVPLVVK